ncbi:ABC transporter permease [Arthrobacter sp. Cr_A7]|uniref:ABC transporter permease n=1 Tax=Arthrobacter sp. Cr_A7 TaxID=3031017 RepID=UPI0023D9CCD2|nr:ABC transporter permease [Arthrobacter sp. Cr_A7]MDF2052233.1 ABC transporter permease [Arthrobacter sp. Cr_A7]
MTTFTSSRTNKAGHNPSDDTALIPGRGPKLTAFFERFALVGLTAIIMLFFGFFPGTSSTYFSSLNVTSVLANQSITALLAIAILFPLIVGHFDFSAAASSSISSVVIAAVLGAGGIPEGAAVACGIASGALVGCVNGLLVAGFGMNSFVTTLAMATFIGGMIQLWTGGQQILLTAGSGLAALGTSRFLGLSPIIFLVVAAVALAWYLLQHTPYGRRLYAIGSNARTSSLIGLSVRRHVFSAFVLSGVLGGIVGVFYVSRMGASAADAGNSLMFAALAAVFLGATTLQPGRYNVLGTVVGVLFVASCVSGLTLAGVDAWVQPVFNGIALLLAIGVSTALGAGRRKA